MAADKESKRRRVGSEAADPPTDAAGEKSQAADYQKDGQVSFRSADEIVRALDSSNTDLLIQGFTHLREHLKICNRAVDSAAPAEARVLRETCRRIVYEWADEAAEFEAVAAAWQLAQKHSVVRLEPLIPGTVARLLETLDGAETFAHGRRLIRMVLDGFMKAVHRGFGTARSAACAASLQLLGQMVAFARGEHADEVRTAFDWTMKAVEELPTIRPAVVGFSIRRLWIRFVLAFFAAERCQGAGELLRTGRLIGGLFRGVERDSYQELHALLSSVHANIVLNGCISRADRRRVFGVQVMGSLARAAQSNTAVVVPQAVGVARPADFGPRATVADDEQPPRTSDSVSALVLRFFRGMMTHPGAGICYHQHGLYPAPHRIQDGTAEDMYDVATFTKSSASAGMHELCNSLILRVLVACINPQGSRRMADLAVDVLRASPELIAPFWRNYRCALEPQLALRYLGSTAFAIKVLALPLPVPAGAAAVPRLNTLIEHVAPFALGRTALGRGLQMRSSALVRYRTLLLVDMVLRKLGAARAWIRDQAALAGSEGAAAWRELDQRLVAAAKQRVPEWKLVVLVHHDLGAAAAAGPAPAPSPDAEEELREHECQHAVLGNALMRVTSGYQEHFGELVLGSHFELGKLVATVRLADVVATATGSSSQRMRNPVAAHTLLFLLQALAAAPAASVNWMARVPPEDGLTAVQHTGLGVVLMVHLFAVQPELRHAARSAAVAALRSTGLFDHGSGEIACWLDALAALASPHAGRAARLSFIPGGRLVLGHGLVAFFEDAIGHAAKQPYKYADRVCAATAEGEDGAQLPFSPLLPAVVEAAVLKAAVGTSELAALLRESPPARAATEMHTAPMFAYIREVACRIAETCGPLAARRLQLFLADGATAVLAPRAAKLSAAAAAEQERRHYAVVEVAFATAVADVLAYLALLGAPAPAASGPDTAASAAKLPSGVAKQLKRDLAATCADVEPRLAAFSAQLVAAVHHLGAEDPRPTATVTRWLLRQAGKVAGAERHAAFVVAITWISQHDRTGGPGWSLWDHAPFVELAPEILQIDDLAFLDALYRHLLASRSPGVLLANPSVQRLLAHMLVALRGSATFCSTVSRLVSHLASGCFEDDGKQLQAASFLCALVVRHAASMAPGAGSAGPDRAACVRALEVYADALGQPSCGNGQVPQQLEFNAAELVRMTAEEWLSPSDAMRIWGPLAARIAARTSSMCAAGAMAGEDAPYLLLLTRLVCVALDDSVRVRLVSDLGAAAAATGDLPVGVYCAATTAALALLRGLAGSTPDEERRTAEAAAGALCNRVLSLWADSLDSAASAAADRPALDGAALQVTAAAGAVLPRRAGGCSVVADIRGRAAAVKAQLPRFGGRGLPSAAVDVDRVLEHMWRNARSRSALAADATTRTLLARIIALNVPAQTAACAWARRVLLGSSRLTVARGRLVAWLLSAAATECSAADAYGRVVWDDDAHSRAVRECCLVLAQRLFGGTADHIASIAADEHVLFIATVFAQGADDGAAITSLYAAVASDAADPLSLARVTLLRSRMLRGAAYPGQPDTIADVVAELMDLARSAIPTVADVASLAEPRCWKVVAVLASAVEFFQQLLAGQATGAAADRCVRSIAGGVGAVLESVGRPFELGVDMTDAEVRSAVGCYPPAVFRFVAYAIQSADRICVANAPTPRADHGWFAMLRRLLGCRFFNARAYAAETRELLALTVLGLWRLARPALSRWSASLDDYLALDELESLTGAYSGTSTLADRALLQVVREYESTTRQSTQRVALVFGPTAAAMYTKERVSRIRYCIERDENAVGVVGEETVAAALAAVDSARMHDTIVDFPIASCDLCLVTGGDEAGPPRLADLLASGAPPRSVVGDLDGPLEEQTPGYDPQFILPWLWAVVSCGESVDLRRVIECHAAGVAIAALSSASPPVRKIAYFILDLLYTEVAEAEYLIGKRQCMLLLDALRNGITGRTATEFPRLPFPLTLFAATALHTMVHPEHAMFGNVNRLLLKRPYLRAGGIPLLRVVLRSSMDTHAHRALVLAQACQAARAFSQCPAAFRRCDLVNLVLAVATSTLADAQAGRAALTMLFHLTSPANTAVLAEHVSKGQFSLLAWIRAQISLEANSLRAAAAQARAQLNRPGGPGIAPPTAQALLAATANLTALARLVVRTAANFPPVKLGTGALAYNRFWAVTSPDQPGAAGQSAAMCVFQQALDAAADAMSLLDTAVGARQALAAVALVRTCVDGAQLLADIQRTCAFSKAPALQSPRLVRSALALVRLTEPAVEREAATAELECPVSFVVRHDPCAVAAVAHAQHPAALFATETALAGVGDTSLTPATRGALGLYACYRACIDGLFVWATATPGRSAESMDIVSRALVVGAPASASAVAWMRSCRDLTDQETIF